MIGENIFKDILKRSLIILTIGVIIILLGIKNPRPYIYGLFFGMAINVLNFRLMSLSIKKSLSLDLSRAQKHTTVNYMMRYVIYGIVLYIAAIADHIDLLSVIIGFFTVKFIIITDTFYDLLRKKKDS